MSLLSDKRRFVLECDAMRERWGDAARLRCDDAGTRFWWDVALPVEGNIFPFRVQYPDDYPASPPNIVVLADFVPANTPHVLSGKRLCWRYPGEAARHRNIWNPAEDTAALVIGVAQRWALAFLVWISTGRGQWPVPDAGG